ncbi:MAG TPA: hypothetical protein VF903_11285 [Nitrospirota bacterium]
MAGAKVKPRLNYTLICDDVRQELGGKFSLMGLFESIYANSFPALHHRFAIVNEWTGGRGEFVVKIRLLSPDREQTLSESESKLSLFNETQRHRDISIRFNTTFKVPGTYWIETLVDNEQAGIIPLSVQMVTEQKVH